jgi:UDP-N-acetylglucosamine diphosphorylase/glucosamine-1-phosphate N-acetyltransferase
MNLAIVILAAGLGTRMKSDKAKVLHEVLGSPMILHVMKAAEKIAENNVVLVVGHQAETVREVVSEHYQALFALQEKQLGTGHAVLCAMPVIPEYIRHIIILCGDVPLIRTETIRIFFEKHIQEKRDVSVLAVETDEPKGYGRVMLNGKEEVLGIIEEKDATAEQRNIKLINTGIYCVNKDFLGAALQKIRPENVQGEFYLTDIIGIAYKEEKSIGVMISKDIGEFVGVNTHQHLKTAEEIMRKRTSEIS